MKNAIIIGTIITLTTIMPLMADPPHHHHHHGRTPTAVKVLNTIFDFLKPPVVIGTTTYQAYPAPVQVVTEPIVVTDPIVITDSPMIYYNPYTTVTYYNVPPIRRYYRPAPPPPPRHRPIPYRPAPRNNHPSRGHRR